MKLLLENWRKYLLDEQRLQEASMKRWEDWTVADLQELINMSRAGESGQAQSLLGRLLGREAFKLIPYAGQMLTGGEMLMAYYNKLKRTPEKPDMVEDFPALAVLNIDPHLITTIEDDILDRVDEQYQEYLAALGSETKLSKVATINDFIRRQIAQDTDNHVVIRDESE
jgi:hypothetical protein